MVPQKWIVNGASKGKAIATTGGMTPPPTNNQPHAKDTGSFSPQEPSASVQPSSKWEDQLFQMLYEMREQIKEQQTQYDREREQMAQDHENIFWEKEELSYSTNSVRLKSLPPKRTLHKWRATPSATGLPISTPSTYWSRRGSWRPSYPLPSPNCLNARFSFLLGDQECEYSRKFLTPTFDYYSKVSDLVQHIWHFWDKMVIYPAMIESCASSFLSIWKARP